MSALNPAEIDMLIALTQGRLRRLTKYRDNTLTKYGPEAQAVAGLQAGINGWEKIIRKLHTMKEG